jgi:lipoate-protein ligase A
MEARIILDSGHDGPWNMACDEALAHYAGETGVPVLRLYQWKEPTLSLGYFQSFAERSSHEPSAGCTVVRRASGGGALLHDHECTYSLAIPNSTVPDGQSIIELIHRTLCQCLRDRGLPAAFWGEPIAAEREAEFLCFRRRTPHDLVLNDFKIVGSAQRKRKRVLMQHGGILLARSKHAPELPGIADLAVDLATPVDVEDLTNDWIDTLMSELSWQPEHSEVSLEEKELANHLRNSRFLNSDWTFKRI